MLRVPNTTSLRRLFALGENEVFDGPPASGPDARAVSEIIDKIEKRVLSEHREQLPMRIIDDEN